MEEEKIKRKLTHLIKIIETELINITWPAAIKQELPETEVLEDIAAETNENVTTYSSNMVLEDEANQRTDEELDKHRKCELNTVILEEEKKCKDSVSNVLTPGDVSFELNRFESFPRQTGSSSSSASSQSSFVIVEPVSYVNEKFEFGDLKEESNLILKEFTITDNKMISQDTVDKKRSDTVAKHFDISENTGREQDSSLLIRDEIKDLRRTLGKCFSYLGKLETIALKRDKLHLEESNKFSKSDENDVKIAIIRKKGNNSDLMLSSSHTLKSNVSTYANNKKSLQEWLVHFNSYNGNMEFPNRERYAYDRCNGRCFDYNSFVFEWGLDTYVIKGDGNCSIQKSKSDVTENHLLNRLVASPGETDMVEKDRSEEYYSKNNKKSNLNKTKVTKNNAFKSCVPSFTNIGEKKRLWEYYRNINLYHHQQNISDLTNSIAAKNQLSDEASPKKHDEAQKEIIERLCRERNEVVTKLERISDLIDETEKQRIIKKRRQDKEFGLICLILLFVYMLVICCFCFTEFPNVD